MPENAPLDARLMTVAELALEALAGKESPRAADVGCDHGLLSAYLLEALPGLTLLASDVSAPSLDKARRLLARHGFDARARFAVADGLSALDAPPDAVILAGMGAHTILGIVRAGMDRLGDATLIVQANVNVPELRAGLAALGYAVEREAYAEVAGRHYTALRARRARPRGMGEREAFLGAAAEGAGDERARAQLLWRRGVLAGEAGRIARRSTASARKKLEENLKKIGWIGEALGVKEITAKELEALVGEIAPYELAEEWDNVGLLVGRGEQRIGRVLVALDATDAALGEARALGAQALVTHHPMMFHARKRLTDADREGRLLLDMVRDGMALVAAHTNLDAAPGGVNDTLLAAMGCENIRGEGCVRVGDLPAGATLGALRQRAESALGASVRVYGPEGAAVSRLGCCSGAGGSELEAARALGADCFLTGEIRHHEALDAAASGMPVLEAGHYETENPVCEVLARALQKRLDALKYTVTVFVSKADPFGRQD